MEEKETTIKQSTKWKKILGFLFLIIVLLIIFGIIQLFSVKASKVNRGLSEDEKRELSRIAEGLKKDNEDYNYGFTFNDEDKQNPDWPDGIYQESVAEQLRKLKDFNDTLEQYDEKNDDIEDIKKMFLKRDHIVLYGPPGTGKTHISKLYAENEAYAYISVSLGNDKYVGSGRKKVEKLLESAKKILTDCYVNNKSKKPIVIILDEFEVMAQKRSSSERGHKNEEVDIFIRFIDSIKEEKEKIEKGKANLGNIVIIGITNLLHMLDPAILRSGGRMGEKIEVPWIKPSEWRKGRIADYLRKENFKADGKLIAWENLRSKKKGNSLKLGPDDEAFWNEIETVIEKTAEKKEKKLQETKEGALVIISDIDRAWNDMITGVAKDKTGSQIEISGEIFQHYLEKVLKIDKEGENLVPKKVSEKFYDLMEEMSPLEFRELKRIFLSKRLSGIKHKKNIRATLNKIYDKKTRENRENIQDLISL